MPETNGNEILRKRIKELEDKLLGYMSERLKSADTVIMWCEKYMHERNKFLVLSWVSFIFLVCVFIFSSTICPK